MRCEKTEERGAAAPASRARDSILQLYRFVQAGGLKVTNPAADIRPSSCDIQAAGPRTNAH